MCRRPWLGCCSLPSFKRPFCYFWISYALPLKPSPCLVAILGFTRHSRVNPAGGFLDMCFPL